MPRRRSTLAARYTPQAQAQADLRYGPQERDLMALLDEAKGQRTQSIRSARGTAGALRRAIAQTRPVVERNYLNSGQNLASLFGDFGREREALGAGTPPAGPGTINRDLAGLGAQANNIIAAALSEQAQAQAGQTIARQNALQDLDAQSIRAQEGAGYAVRQANDKYASDSAKILKQLMGVTADKDLYTATTLGDLTDKARGRGATRGNAKAGRDAGFLKKFGVTEDDFLSMTPAERQKLIKSTGGSKGTHPYVTPENQEKFQAEFRSALNEAKLLKQIPATPEEIAALLAHGVKAQPEKTAFVYEQDHATGKQRKKLNPDGTPVTRVISPAVDAIEPIKDPLVLQAAVEVATKGYITRKTVKALHRAAGAKGYRVRPLGVQIGAPKVGRGPAPTVTLAPGVNGQSRPT